MTPDAGTVERRRELLAELERERSRAIAYIPADDDEPASSSALWPVGVTRLLAAAQVREGDERRQTIRNLCVVTLAWLEAFDR